MTLIWVIVFIAALIALVKGADWLIASSEKIGLAVGLSPFIVGVIIVGLGTSFPELVSSIVAVMQGVTEVVAANAIGSNIANILLVVGISAIVGGRLTVTKSLIDLDLPLLAIGTVLFLGIVYDRVVTLPESILLIVVYFVYLLYTVFHREENEEGIQIPFRRLRRKAKVNHHAGLKSIKTKDWILLVLGILALVFGAKYLIDSLIALSSIFNIAPGAIAISAVAIGTSLPELIVSLKAALQKKSELALGNIFGSNLFNILVVVGIPGLMTQLKLDDATFMVGLPAMIAATLLFVISGISRRIHMWEGAFYLGLYVLFVGKLFGLM